MYRKSCPETFCKKITLRNFENPQEKTFCKRLF